jgi:NAD(P)-dependent dehydrogenase (short-subunit alcohol dehydrogenase family)
LAGRTALVTGASRGIGARIAARLAAEGAAVVITARTAGRGEHPLPGSLAETAERIRAVGGRVLAVRADITHPAAREDLVRQGTAEFGGIDILVNNAAVSWFEPTVTYSAKRLELMYELLLHAPVALAQLTLPGMIERRYGRIVNISSPGARHPEGPPYRRLPPVTVYGMFKAALERFTSGLAAETYDSGIGVSCVAPEKLVVTEAAAYHGWDKKVPPENREPAAVTAEAVLALCTADREAVTGRTFYAGRLLHQMGIPCPAS